MFSDEAEICVLSEKHRRNELQVNLALDMSGYNIPGGEPFHQLQARSNLPRIPVHLRSGFNQQRDNINNRGNRRSGTSRANRPRL